MSRITHIVVNYLANYLQLVAQTYILLTISKLLYFNWYAWQVRLSIRSESVYENTENAWIGRA